MGVGEHNGIVGRLDATSFDMHQVEMRLFEHLLHVRELVRLRVCVPGAPE